MPAKVGEKIAELAGVFAKSASMSNGLGRVPAKPPEHSPNLTRCLPGSPLAPAAVASMFPRPGQVSAKSTEGSTKVALAPTKLTKVSAKPAESPTKLAWVPAKPVESPTKLA
jgi:hypothetical protein